MAELRTANEAKLAAEVKRVEADVERRVREQAAAELAKALEAARTSTAEESEAQLEARLAEERARIGTELCRGRASGVL